MFTRPTPLFTKDEIEQLTECIRQNENDTSGEIRLFIEKRCAFTDPSERARQLFINLQMQQTHQRNGVLIYIAWADRDFALLGDRGIFEKAPADFWKNESKALSQSFQQKEYFKGALHCINQVGHLLKTHFPPLSEPKNELPDDIIFGN